MRCVPKYLLLSLILLCAACSNRQLENKLAETEQNTDTVKRDVQALEQRVQSMENRLEGLSTEVTSLEVKTLQGKKTNYMIVPTIKAGSALAPVSSAPLPVAAAHATRPATAAAVPAATGQKTDLVSPPVSSSPALRLPPTTAPVVAPPVLPASPVAPAATGAPATPIDVPVTPTGAPAAPATSALALPPENATTGQTMASGSPVPAPASIAIAAAAPSASGVQSAPVQVAPVPKQKGEEAAYNAALALARGGKSTEAITRFKAFLQEYPSGRYAPNAYYWMGECLYAQRQYADALLQFKDVATRYPRHHKSADALLKAGMTYSRMGDKENASLQYKAVVTDFPASEAARYVKGRGLAR